VHEAPGSRAVTLASGILFNGAGSAAGTVDAVGFSALLADFLIDGTLNVFRGEHGVSLDRDGAGEPRVEAICWTSENQ